MKCPYRKQTTTKNGENGIIYEDFMECYKEECPYYYKGKYSYNEQEYEECQKAINENFR